MVLKYDCKFQVDFQTCLNHVSIVTGVNRPETTLETSEDDVLPLLPHMYSTVSEPILSQLKVKSTLKTSEKVKLHSKRVKKFNYTRNECVQLSTLSFVPSSPVDVTDETTLKTSEKDSKKQSTELFCKKLTDFLNTQAEIVLSKRRFLGLPDTTRGMNYTRFECSSLVWGVVHSFGV